MGKIKITLAEALLRRKELNGKVDMLKSIKQVNLFEVKVRRQAVTDSIEDITAQVPKLTASQVTAELDWHARQLRLIDAIIQQTNWITKIEINTETMEDFIAKKN